MGLSWSAMRKVLEDENICVSLKGRVQYFVTRYRESHDQEGRVAVRLDGNEIFKSNFYDGEIKRHEARSEMCARGCVCRRIWSARFVWASFSCS